MTEIEVAGEFREWSKVRVSSLDSPVVYIAHDEKMAIVSLLPVGVVGGRADINRWGSVFEITPAITNDSVARARQGRAWASILGLGFLMGGIGARWWLSLLPIAAAGYFAALLYEWRQRSGVISAPQLESRRDKHHVLVDVEERKAFSEAVDIGKRAAQTWPALGGLIHVATAERMLAQALFDLATVLERRQTLRGLRDDLAMQQLPEATASGSAARELTIRKERVNTALKTLNSEVNRRLAAITAAATTGENFIQEQEVRQLTRDVDNALATLTPPDLPGIPDFGSELVEHTEAVLAAYRELDADLGDDR